MRGSKIVEVKSIGFNKGTEVVRLVNNNDYDFVMAMGDDIIDDDMFHSLPEDAITIKMGSISSIARYSLMQHETNKFLNSLIADTNSKVKTPKPRVKNEK